MKDSSQHKLEKLRSMRNVIMNTFWNLMYSSLCEWWPVSSDGGRPRYTKILKFQLMIIGIKR